MRAGPTKTFPGKMREWLYLPLHGEFPILLRMASPLALYSWRSTLLDWYFRLNFLAVAVLGAAAWFARIPNHQIIPVVVIAYSVVLIPVHFPRFLLGHVVLFLFPFTVWFNNYGYQLALQCWLPVLLNLFFVYLGKPNTPVFNGLAAFHACVLVGIFLGHPHANRGLDLLGVVTNIFAALLLMLTMHLVIANTRLSEENREFAEKQRAFSQGLKRVIASVIHDMSRWTSLSHLGLALSEGEDKELHEFIRMGIAGADELAMRIKEIVQVDHFAFLESHVLAGLLEDLRPSAAAILPMRIECPASLRQVRVLVDKVLFGNAILNLVQNAAKAGALTFEIQASDGPSGIRLDARDDGKGFPEGVLRELLRHPVASGNGGTGTGLLNVKFNLAFLGAEILLTEANVGGLGKTCLSITGIRKAETAGAP
jgi:signal transduction histidine kinase